MRTRWTLALALLVPWTARAAETVETLDRARRRSDVWAGPAVVLGQLEYEAPSARISTRLDALPAISAGVELWPEESIGVHLAGIVGLGADLDLPQGGALAYSAHQVEAGARYRWFVGPRSDAPAVFAGLGLRALHQSVQEQRPALLVSSTTVGPELAAGGELPLGAFRLRATARGGLPFFVREAPADSGDPRRTLGYGGRLEAVTDLGARWSVAATGDALWQTIDYGGDGTRAAGVKGGRTRDRLLTMMLVARHRL